MIDMNDKKTILHLERIFTSPTETFIFNQINGLVNFEKLILTTKVNNSFNHDFLVINPVNVFLNNKWILLPHAIKKIFNLLKGHKIDLIHSHYLTDASFFLPITKKINCPKICSVYGYDISEFPKKYLGLGKFYISRIFAFYDLILVMSPDMKSDLMKIGCPENKIKIHYFGNDVNKFININRNYSLHDNKINLLTIASLREKKGHEFILRALNEIKNKINFHYHIVGDGPLITTLSNMVKHFNLNDHVTFHGHINYSNSIKFYNSADVFILPSVTSSTGDKEGIPGVLVEAMANGLPIISSFHAGIDSIIENNITGLLHEEKDYKSISDSIMKLYDNYELREKLGVHARDYALNHLDYRFKTLELESIYNDLIQGSV